MVKIYIDVFFRELQIYSNLNKFHFLVVPQWLQIFYILLLLTFDRYCSVVLFDRYRYPYFLFINSGLQVQTIETDNNYAFKIRK